MSIASLNKIISILSLLLSIFFGLTGLAKVDINLVKREIFELRIYHFTTAKQEANLDGFFKNALLPALHFEGIKKIGVFKVIGNDTAADKKLYVLIPFKSFDQRQKITNRLFKNKLYNEAGSEFINAAYNTPAYNRMETIFLQAFEYMSSIAVPTLQASKKERVYELRSYESASEKIYKNKVEMFNQGGEVALFKRLGFNAVFYGEVIAGSHMPNLMYMTSFENMQARDEHWKSFGASPEWKTLSAMKEYQNNVSKNTILFLTPAEYSDL